jgi:hypothetical protein
MSDAPAEQADPAMALVDFGRTRDELEAAFRAVPDEALRYLPEGDEYALGGLAVHVTEVLAHYSHVLDEMRAAGFQEVRVVEPPPSEAVRVGFGGDARGAVFESMRAAHDRLAANVGMLAGDDYTRKAPVYYGTAAEPVDTSAADIMGWMIGHYRDHAKQVADMLATWQQAKA